MFVVTKLDVSTNTVSILNMAGTETEAIQIMHKEAMKIKEDDKSKVFDLLDINISRVEVVERQFGWIYNSKDLLFVFQIIHFEGPKKDIIPN